MSHNQNVNGKNKTYGNIQTTDVIVTSSAIHEIEIFTKTNRSSH